MKRRRESATSVSARAPAFSSPVLRLGLIGLAMVAAVAALAAILVQRPAADPLPPTPAHYLEDQANLLSPEFAAAKNQYLEYLSRTARIAQINIVILPRAPSGDIEEFTIRATTAWKIGAAGVDNGLALFVFRDDRKLRLEVGYGLEPVITDAVANRLLTEVLAPAFGRGQFESGIEDFLDILNKMLESSEAANHRASQAIDMIPFVANVLRNSPNFGRKVGQAFVEADTGARIGMSLFGLIFAGLLVYALVGVLRGIAAIIMLPWRLYSSPSLRSVTLAKLSEQFSPRNFFAQPPPLLISLFSELQLAPIANAAYMLLGIMVGIAFLFAGSSMFVGGLGQLGGGGATASWPAI